MQKGDGKIPEEELVFEKSKKKSRVDNKIYSIFFLRIFKLFSPISFFFLSFFYRVFSCLLGFFPIYLFQGEKKSGKKKRGKKNSRKKATEKKTKR